MKRKEAKEIARDVIQKMSTLYYAIADDETGKYTEEDK